MLVAKIVLGWSMLMFIPTLCSAALGRGLGVVINEISLGNGPLLLRKGKLSIRLIPWSSFVRFKHTQEIEVLDLSPADAKGAVDQQSLWINVLVALSGPGTLLAIGLLLLGREAFESFFAAFQQIFVGAVFPLSEAQRHLSAFAAESARSGSLALGVVATKLAAFQLFPLHSQPGLRLVGAIIPAVERRAANSPLPFFLALLAIILSWLIAGGTYLMG